MIGRISIQSNNPQSDLTKLSTTDRKLMLKKLISSRQQLDLMHKRIVSNERLRDIHSNRQLNTRKVSIVNISLPEEESVKTFHRKPKKCSSLPEINVEDLTIIIDLPQPKYESPTVKLTEKRKTLYDDSKQKYLAIRRKLNERTTVRQKPLKKAIVNEEIEKRLPRRLRTNPSMKLWFYN